MDFLRAKMPDIFQGLSEKSFGVEIQGGIYRLFCGA